ncbi:MAG: S9 family peptidase [Ignavibacteriales bacterium]|nr:S9 family peptidase [Ignavibacteriales bacterium]
MKTLSRFLLTTFIAASTLPAQNFHYPRARTVDVVDNFHGTTVADPYRWMEQEDDPELKAWIEKQNELTFGYVRNIPARERFKERLQALWNYPRYSVPFRRGKRTFFSKNDGLQNQSVLYMQDGLDGEARVVIDPNKLSDDGTIALGSQSYTRDGSLLAYGLSKSGSDWQEIRVRDLNTGRDYDEVLQWCKFAALAWTHDNRGFFYNRFPDPATTAKEEQSYNMKVYWHELGKPQLTDRLVYERLDAKELGFHPFITDDGQYLVLHVWKGTDTENRIYYRETAGTGNFVRLLDEADAAYQFIENIGPVFYFNTTLEAPRGRIIAIDVNKPARQHWKEIIPQQSEPIAFARVINDQFVVAYLKDARHDLRIFTVDGKPVREISLPTVGTIAGISGERKDTMMFFGFTSFLYPTTIFQYDFKSNQTALFRKSELKFDPSGYETKQVFYQSKDGTRIPMFLTHKRGLVLDGTNPTLLFGYGGFNAELLPSFSVSRIAWLEQGGVFAVANLRGGGEYGEEWHRAGMLEKKQNVFDDFIAAAEWLIANKYTKSSRLAIQGGSNGGLLVAASMLQRPDLFGAVVCQVPVADMLRYHRFTIGRYWTGEYGNAETNPEHFKFMIKYSPLHNVKKGVAYPPTIITTADHDDRVVPAHSMKFAATLQANDAGKNPILLRVETKAGHGGGKPISKLIEELADVLAFVVKALDVPIM